MKTEISAKLMKKIRRITSELYGRKGKNSTKNLKWQQTKEVWKIVK